MDVRINKLVETTLECKGSKGHFFYFRNLDGDDIAVVSWCTYLRLGRQSLTIEIKNGEYKQLMRLVNVYLGAKVFAEQFDLDMITFLFEQFAQNENIDIICD